jgi:hypothetical protein
MNLLVKKIEIIYISKLLHIYIIFLLMNSTRTMAFSLSPKQFTAMAKLLQAQQSTQQVPQQVQQQLPQTSPEMLQLLLQLQLLQLQQQTSPEMLQLQQQITQLQQQLQQQQSRRRTRPVQFRRRTGPIEPQNYKTVICKHGEKCIRGGDCTYWHEGDEEPRPQENARFSINECQYGERCRSGDTCHFLHLTENGTMETPAQMVDRVRGVHKNWKTLECRGNCGYKPLDCHWNHGVTVGEGDDAIEI